MADAAVLENAFLSMSAGLASAQKVFKRGDIMSALRVWAELRRQFPEDPTPLAAAAAALLQIGRLDEAESLVAGDLEKFPTNFAMDRGLSVIRGRIAHLRRDYPEAIRRWEHVREHFAEQVGYTGGAHSLQEAGRFVEADALLRIAREKFPDEPGPFVYHAGLAMAQRDYEEAVRRWEKVRERYPKEPGAYANPAIALRELRQFDEADALLRSGLKQLPDDVRLLNDYATLAQSLKDWAEANRRWAEVRRCAPESHVGYINGAKALREMRELEEAHRLLLEPTTSFRTWQKPLSNSVGWRWDGRISLKPIAFFPRRARSFRSSAQVILAEPSHERGSSAFQKLKSCYAKERSSYRRIIALRLSSR